MRQNINTNSVKKIDAELYNANYYDFMLRTGISTEFEDKDIEGLQVVDMTFDNISSGTLYSSVSWSGAVSDGIVLDDIGTTGMDNGLISFMKDRISNKQFLDLWLNSKITINSGNTALFMNPVTGNTQTYSYPMEVIDDGTDVYMAGKGGFYQGFFKLEGFDYEVLPDNVDDAWALYFELRPRTDYSAGLDTINYTHSGNSGIFFYIGTRAENKFWPFYKTDSAIIENFKRPSAENDGYFASGDGYNIKSEDILSTKEWLMEEHEDSYFAEGDPYFAGMEDTGKPDTVYGEAVIVDGKSPGAADFLNTYGYNSDSYCGYGGGDGDPAHGVDYSDGGWCECENYFADGYYAVRCPDNNKAIEDDYMESEVGIDFNGYDDSMGRPMSANGFHEIATDNKFILFDRTRSGFTVNNWDNDAKAVLRYRKNWPDANYFMLINRTETGYTVDTIDEYNSEHQTDYSIYRDIVNNAFALRIKEDNAIGYRYGIRDCASGGTYGIVEEYSASGVIKPGEWNNVVVRILNLGGKKMKVMIYVGGRLTLSSKSLDIFDLHAIDDVPEKQEGVPYSISIGGGTQGLMEAILPNYYAIPDYVLPLERDFCGSFIGDIKTFRFYCGDVSYSAINHYLS